MLRKRVAALFCAAVFSISSVPCVGMATEDVTAAVNSLTYETITSQVKDFITEDLTLPDEAEGVAVTWSTSDSSVIDASGKVTRHASEEKSVTLTADIGGTEKEFAFTVSPELYVVHCSEAFAYPQYDGSVVTKLLPDWSTRWNNTAYYSTHFKSETLESGETNHFIYSDLWKDRPYYNLKESFPEGRISVNMKVYMDIADDFAGMYDYEFVFGSNTVRTRFWFTADNKVSELRFYGGAPSGVSLGITKANALNLRRRWVNMTWEFDTDLQKTWYYIDGELINSSDGTDSAYLTAPLKRIDYNIGTNTVGLSLGTDDLAVVSKHTNKSTVDVINTYNALTEEALSEQAKTAITQNLDLSLAALGDNKAADVSFESSDPAITINGDAGAVTRGDEDTEVTVTATVSKSGTDYTKQKKLKFTVKSNEYIVYHSESFRYPDLEGERVAAENGGWSLSREPVQDGCLDAVYGAEKDGNRYIKALRTVSDTDLGITDGATFRYKTTNTSKSEITFEMRLMFGEPLEDGSSQIYNLTANGTYDVDGESVSKELSRIQMYCSKSSVSMRINAYDETVGTSSSTALASSMAVPGEWFTLKLEYDFFNKTVNVWVNGKLITEAPANFEVPTGTCKGMTTLSLTPFRTLSFGEIYIDDFAAYSVQGMTSSVALYKNTERVDDLGYFTDGDSVSADVQLYNFDEENTVNGATIVAGAYNGETLIQAASKIVSFADGVANVSFPEISTPADMNKLVLKFFFLDADGNISPLKKYYEVPRKLNGEIIPYEITDSETGRTYHAIDLKGEDAIRSYYTMTTWAKNDEKFYFYDTQYRLFEYDVETYKYRYIDTMYNQNLVTVSQMGNLFYVNKYGEIIKMNTSTDEKTVVGELYENVISAQLLQVSSDESYISMECNESISSDLDTANEKRIPVMNVQTGEWDLSHKYGFDVPTYAPDHMNLNPKYPNLVSFAHEGSGSDGAGCTDRIWVVDRDTDTYTNLFKQKMKDDTHAAETVSHEAWMPSGEKMMFAALHTNDSETGERVTPAGITLVNRDGSDRHYVNNDYSYLHPSGSYATDRFVVSDTAYDGKTTKLVLIDTYSGESHLLATLPQLGEDPGHTHPSFTLDGNKVIFGLSSEDLSTMRVGWMDVSDIIKNAPDGEEITLSSSCTSTSYEGQDFYVSKETHATAGTLYRVASGNHLNVNVKSVEKEAADLSVTVEYLDEGTDNIVIDYVVWIESNGKYTSRSRQATIARTGSGELKSATLTLEGANVENLKLMGADFTISGDSSDVAIKSVSAVEITQ